MSSFSAMKRSTKPGSSNRPFARATASRRLQRVLRPARAADAEALEAEQRLGHGPAVVQLADERVARHAHVVEEHLAELLVAGEVADRAQRDARRLQVHQQEADALLLLRRLVGAHQQVDVRRVVGERGPDLLAVDDEVIAVEHRGGLQAREIGAGVGLGVALAPDVLAGAACAAGSAPSAPRCRSA